MLRGRRGSRSSTTRTDSTFKSEQKSDTILIQGAGGRRYHRVSVAGK
jgi:hypothetical protein